jgi:hypothetical protein
VIGPKSKGVNHARKTIDGAGIRSSLRSGGRRGEARWKLLDGISHESILRGRTTDGDR